MLPTTLPFNKDERKTTAAAAFIIALRLFGLFMILPIFSIYALGLMYATPFNIGITLGIYGLAAMIMQPVFGYLSDKHGRLKMIIVGLVLFISGSLVAAFAGNIYTMMLGRFLQGSGALSGMLLALISDHTRAEVRSKAMAIISITIACGFLVALVLGPILAMDFGLEGLFALTAFLGLIALNLAVILPRNTPAEREHLGIHIDKIKLVLKNKTILLLNVSVFLLNTLLIANFVILPSLLLKKLYLSPHQTWWLYLVSMGIALILMFVFLMITERFFLFKKMVILTILLMMFGELAFFTHFDSVSHVIIGLTLFFTGFLTLETLLPSWLSRIVTQDLKGTALGIFASAQFCGAFAGGLFGAYFGNAGGRDLFLYLLSVCVIWFIAVTLDLKQRPK